jgi:hypothetical protein
MSAGADGTKDMWSFGLALNHSARMCPELFAQLTDMHRLGAIHDQEQYRP